MRTVAAAVLCLLLAACGQERRQPAATEPAPAPASSPAILLGDGPRAGSGGGSVGGGTGTSDEAALASLRRELRTLDPDDDAAANAVLEAHAAAAPIPEMTVARVFAERLRHLTRDPSPKVAAGAISLLGRMPREAVGALDLAQCAGDPWVRRQVILTAGRRSDDRAKVAALRWAGDPDRRVRWALARALRGSADPKCLAALHGLFLDEDPDVVRVAADSLERTLPEISTEVLQASTSTNPVVRACSARLMGQLPAPVCLPRLAALVSDPQWEVRAQAMRALGGVPAPDADEAARTLVEVAADTKLSRTDRFEAIQSLAATEGAVDHGVLARVATQDPDRPLRLVACRALLARRDPRAVVPLVALLWTEVDQHNDHEDREFVREIAAATLLEVAGDGRARAPSAWEHEVRALEAAVARTSFRFDCTRLREFW